ncbi:RCC1 domain-containing protein [Paraliomyxa miuraensis]|uniref:RCC1 domain-containing protein n=1 Tax=Paraliomyxa miuraensis TaxID=376150 RepID=UPI00224CCDB1|nr:hypothetical protein [Paraliomyxa miuraensis]MCX4243979.1 hypothetical protein [Paraliomyxa miuraensis]
MLLGACDESPTKGPWELDGTSLRSATTPPTIEAMAVGDGHTWALMSDGTLQGWGGPDCEPNDCPVPSEITPLSFHATAVEVHANDDRVLARLADGTVLTWTADAMGLSMPTPITLGHSAPITQLALGSGFVCVRFEDGRVDCQGLGQAIVPPSLVGTVVDAGAVDLTAGASHACAVLATGAVECWGDDSHGQRGTPSSTGGTTIALSGPAQRVVAGADHSCALLDGGEVECWGRNDEGQLGHTGTGVSTVPLGVAALQVVAGAEHSCAIASPDRDLYCWGNDDLGRLGSGETVHGLRRVDLDGLSANTVFSGSSAWTTFAILDDDGLRGWGDNDVAQLGYGDDDDPLIEGFTVEQRTSLAVGRLPDIIIYDDKDS